MLFLPLLSLLILTVCGTLCACTWSFEAINYSFYYTFCNYIYHLHGSVIVHLRQKTTATTSTTHLLPQTSTKTTSTTTTTSTTCMGSGMETGLPRCLLATTGTKRPGRLFGAWLSLLSLLSLLLSLLLSFLWLLSFYHCYCACVVVVSFFPILSLSASLYLLLW